ncbi:MAG: acyl-CoA dehydrogenase family protein [Moorellales bacterium]
MDFRLDEEQESIRRTVRRIMTEKVAPRAKAIDEEEQFPWDVKELFAENGIFALAVPPEYGGIDGRLTTYCAAMEEVARVCASSSMILGNQSLGSIPIIVAGNEEQKRKYLPPIAEGEILPAFALTEPNAGSDIASMQTRAIPDGDGYVITGTKTFITNAPVADLFTVFAKVPTQAGDQISAFLVERGTPGLSTGKVEKKMGLRGSPTGEVVLDGVRVGADKLLGKIGEGFRIAMKSLDKGRIGTAFQAIGLAQGALEAAVDYACTRVQFGVPIIEHQGIQFLLADMETKVQTARWLGYYAAWKYDRQDPDVSRYSAMAKLWATDMVMDVTRDAVQVFGGYGYTREYPVERMMRDAKIFAIFEGTNQIQRIVIARALAAGRRR